MEVSDGDQECNYDYHSMAMVKDLGIPKMDSNRIRAHQKDSLSTTMLQVYGVRILGSIEG